MKSSNVASRHEQAILANKYLSVTQRLKLVYTLAKCEVETHPLQLSLSEMPDGKVEMDDTDLFVICVCLLVAIQQ